MRALLVSVASFVLSSMTTAQTTWYVDVYNPPPGSGTINDPYSSIQYAIDQPETHQGDEILVLPGIYAENLDFHGKSLVLFGQQGPAITSVDGMGIAPVLRLESGEGPPTRIEGFTLLNGYGVLSDDQRIYGGGIHCGGGSDIEIVNCAIRSNYGQRGAGGYVNAAHVRMTNCMIAENLCGGGLVAVSSTIELTGTTIRDHWNTYCHGSDSYTTSPGLVFYDSNATIADCLIEGNHAYDVASGMIISGGTTSISNTTVARNGNIPQYIDLGGGISISGGGALVIEGSLFQDNWNERRGGALAVSGGVSAQIHNCTFLSNKSTDTFWGGAIYVAPDSTDTNMEVYGSEFSANFSGGGSGLWLGSGTATIGSCAFLNNRAGTCCYEEGAGAGMWIDDGVSATIDDCLFDQNNAGGGPGFAGKGGGIYVRPTGSAIVRRSIFTNNVCQEGYSIYDEFARGGAVSGPAYLENCTLYGNVVEDHETVYGEGGGAYDSMLNSCIVRNNVPDSLGRTTFADWSDIEGGWSGTGNFDADPLFWGAAQGDFHLLPNSPCIDTGDPARTDGDGSRIDVGAFPFDPTYCGGPSTYCEAKVNSLGCVPSIGWSGEPTLTGPDDFHVLATNIVPSKLGILLWSTSGPAGTPFFGGMLCVAPPQHRSSRLFSGGQGGGACDGAFDFHFTHSYMQAQGLVIGSRIYIQLWYRDPMHLDGTGTGLTDGLTATICAAAQN